MLTSWDPFGDIARMQDQMVNMFEGGGTRRGSFVPAVDIYEEKDAVFLDLALPGVKADAVNIEIERKVLTISGERCFDREEGEEGYRRVEHSYGTFMRSFVVPESVRADDIDAELRDGVLRLKLPKRPEAQARRIGVRTHAAGEARHIPAKANEGKGRTQPDPQV